jgi:hypothetical protein
MSARKSIAVTRNYRPAPDKCTYAFELLLKKSVSKKGTRPGAPDDAKEIKSVRATSIILNRP